MYKENEYSQAEIRTYTVTTTWARSRFPGDWATLPLDYSPFKINTVKAFFSVIDAVWSCIYHEFKNGFEEN